MSTFQLRVQILLALAFMGASRGVAAAQSLDQPAIDQLVAQMPAVSRVFEVSEAAVWRPENPEEYFTSKIGAVRGLRRIMVDRTGITDLQKMPPSMREKTMEYLWAELAVARLFFASTRDKHGGIGSLCANSRAYGFQDYATCARYWLPIRSDSYDVSYRFHRATWPQLFPESVAADHIEFVRSKALVSPVLYEPAKTLQMPPGGRLPVRSECWNWSAYKGGASLCALVAADDPCVVRPVHDGAEFVSDYSAGNFKGFVYGPFVSRDEAVRAVERLARNMTEGAKDSGFLVGRHREVAGYILRRRGYDFLEKPYHVSVPVFGPLSKLDGTPQIALTEIDESITLSSTPKCSVPDHFDVSAVFHTHPIYTELGKIIDEAALELVNEETSDTFSEKDWEFASTLRAWKVAGTAKWRMFEGSYLLRPNRCIDFIDGTSKVPDKSKVIPVHAESCSLGQRVDQIIR